MEPILPAVKIPFPKSELWVGEISLTDCTRAAPVCAFRGTLTWC